MRWLWKQQEKGKEEWFPEYANQRVRLYVKEGVIHAWGPLKEEPPAPAVPEPRVTDKRKRGRYEPKVTDEQIIALWEEKGDEINQKEADYKEKEA